MTRGAKIGYEKGEWYVITPHDDDSFWTVYNVTRNLEGNKNFPKLSTQHWDWIEDLTPLLRSIEDIVKEKIDD